MSPFAILAAATRRAWDEYMSVLVISAGWLLAQVLIIPGPPATATLFAMARATHDGLYWGTAEAWAAFRELFWPAWRWGLPNLLVVGLGLYNISVFWNVPGVWAGLRWLWVGGVLVWLGLNLFYWPFYLASADRSWRNTYANCGRFWLLHPLTAVVLLAVALVAGVAAVSTLLPVVLGVAFWLALVAETGVRRSLELNAE
jgi:uncharacterized membrane protein YesL